MATKTTNYNLVKPTDNEFAEISVMNANMDVIDTEMNGLDTNKEGLLKNTKEKITLMDKDALPLVDSADSSKTKKVSFANLKILLKTIFATTEDISALNSSLTAEATARQNEDNAKLNLTGGTLTGDLYFGDNTAKILRSGSILDIAYGGANLRFNSSNGITVRNTGTGEEYKIYHEGNPPPIGGQIVSGSYTGDGTESRLINLGFKPKAVILTGADRNGCTFLMTDQVLWGRGTYPSMYSDEANLLRTFPTNGFNVSCAGDLLTSYFSPNKNSIVYKYVAFM